MHSIQKVLPILLIIATSGLAGPVLPRRAVDLLARNHDEYPNYHADDGYGRHYDDDHRHKQSGLANGADAGNGGFGGNGGNGGYIGIKQGGHHDHEYGHYHARRTEQGGLANGGLGGHGGNGGDGGYGGKIDRHGGFYGHGHADEDGHHVSQGNGGHGGLGGNGGHGGNGGEVHEEFHYGGHHDDHSDYRRRRRGLDEQLNLPALFASGSGKDDILALNGFSDGVGSGKKDPETQVFEKAQEAAARKATLEQIAKENEARRKQDAAPSQESTPQQQQPQRRAAPEDNLEDLGRVLGFGGPLFEVNEDDFVNEQDL